MTKTPKDEKVSSARRRLIKGGLAAPAVVALHSGSALANTSNGRCLDNQLASAKYPKPGPADSWVRVQSWWMRKEQGTDNKPRYFISGADIESLRAGSSKIANSFLPSGSWVEFDLTSQSVIGQVIDPRTTVAKQDIVRQDGPFVAVRVSPYTGGAEIIGVVGPNQAGTAVAGTCWSSFTGMKIR
jgi:hypothetical protein